MNYLQAGAEGHVNRVKMIEPQILGRATPHDPLRKRVLLTG